MHKNVSKNSEPSKSNATVNGLTTNVFELPVHSGLTSGCNWSGFGAPVKRLASAKPPAGRNDNVSTSTSTTSTVALMTRAKSKAKSKSKATGACAPIGSMTVSSLKDNVKYNTDVECDPFRLFSDGDTYTSLYRLNTDSTNKNGNDGNGNGNGNESRMSSLCFDVNSCGNNGIGISGIDIAGCVSSIHDNVKVKASKVTYTSESNININNYAPVRGMSCKEYVNQVLNINKGDKNELVSMYIRVVV